MSGKIEISRELLQWAHDSIDEHVMNAESVKFLLLQAILAAPVVERQEPKPYGWHVEWADSGDAYLFTKVEKRIEVLRLDSDVRVIPLFTSSPEPVADEMVRLLTRARIYARGEFRDEIDAYLAGKTAQVAVSPEPTPYQPKGEWSFERCEDGAIVIKNGKDWTAIKSGEGPIYEQFLYRFCEQQIKELTAPTINENSEFEKWRSTQIDVLVRNGYPEGAEAFRNLGSVQWAGWQARACLDKVKELNQ